MPGMPTTRRFRPFHPLWRLVRPWVEEFGGRLGLSPKLADRGYMVCAIPRSGSKYLDDLLVSTRVLGSPREFFNTDARRRHDPDYPAGCRRQTLRILTDGATPNGIYAVKIFPSHLQRVQAKLDLFRALPNLHLVKLTRRDILGQAISFARAQQTGEFASYSASSRQPVYDHAMIRACLEGILRDQRVWDDIMARNAFPYITLEYESVVEDPQGAVDQVARLMGVKLPVPVDFARVRNEVQRDDINDAWRAKYLAETGGALVR